MAILIEGSKSRHGPPGAVAAKPRASQIAYDSGELRKWQCRCVYLETVQPRQGQLLNIFYAPYRIVHSLYSLIFFVLVVDIFAIGSLERLFPVLPFRMREPGLAADHLWENFLFPHIGVVP